MECDGGIRVYAVPLRARGEVVGTITLGCGDPPEDAGRLRAVAERYGVALDAVRTASQAYRRRPPFVAQIARRQLEAAARCIGVLVERGMADKELRKSEERLRTLAQASFEGNADALSYNRTMLEASPVGIITYKASGSVVSANEAIARMIGATVEQVKAQNFRELDSWRRSGMLAAAETALTTGREQELEAFVVSTFGRDLWLSSRFVPFRFEGEKYLLGLFADVTHRRQAEQRLRFTQFAIDHSAEAAFWIGSDARLIYVNEATCRSLGYSREELASMTLFDIDPDLRREEWAAIWERFKRRGRATLESRHRAKDGRLFPVEIRANFLAFEGQEYDCAFAIDITGRKRAEEERQKLEARMRDTQRLESLGVLAGGIAHDFNNLLMAILGNADLALYSLPPGSPVRRNVEAIEKTSLRAADLCHQMLAYSGQGRYVVGRCDLSEIVREMAQMLTLLGHRVLTAADGREGVEVFRSRASEIDGIILDFTMPDMDGEAAFRDMRRVRGDARVVLSSGYNEQQVTRRFLGEELAGFVQKPYTVERLRETLERALG